MRAALITLTFGFFLVAGLPLAATAGPVPGGADSDGDTVEDAFDNCTEIANPGQEDADHDGCGDFCDDMLLCDTDGDGCIGFNDFGLMSAQWGMTWYPPEFPLLSDCDGDTFVGFNDFGELSATWGKCKGPSGITNPSRDYAECPNR